MRDAWGSFDVIGRDCLEAAAEVEAVVTAPGPIDPNRSGQCSFAEFHGAGAGCHNAEPFVLVRSVEGGAA